MRIAIYLDYSSTTSVDPRVVDKMVPWLDEHFGNPESHSRPCGWEAEKAVEQAREHVAAQGFEVEAGSAAEQKAA